MSRQYPPSSLFLFLFLFQFLFHGIATRRGTTPYSLSMTPRVVHQDTSVSDVEHDQETDGCMLDVSKQSSSLLESSQS